MIFSKDTTLRAFIWNFLKPHKTVVFLFIFLAIAAGLWGPFNSILIKRVIDMLPHTAIENAYNLLWPALIISINFIVFDNFTWRGLAYIRGRWAPIIINNIIQQAMDCALEKSVEFFQNNLSGKISKQITILADSVENLMFTVGSNLLRGGSLLFFTFVTAYFVNSVFCYLLIIWFVFFGSISIWMSKKLLKLSKDQSATESKVVGELVDSLANHSSVRIFARENYEHNRISPFLDDQQKAYYATHWYSLLISAVQGFLIALMMAGCAYFLIYFYNRNLVTVGDFALILSLSMFLGHMMWFTMEQVGEGTKLIGRCRQSLDSLISALKIVDKIDAFSLQVNRGQIKFNKVSFSYGDKKLFKNLSVEIMTGQKVGVVGYSGVGKSTFINLLLRLYEVGAGEILVDNVDIRDVTQNSLHENIGMIPQDPSLFHRSLIENIRYGRVDASNEEVITASKKAHLHEFISGLPEGYQTLVGERGVKLSGGQRQRIAIARAILKNAPIIILDEATSQLDSVTEQLIQESLWEIVENKTTIVIAHRLSTLLHMDRILVFDKGEIVEDGSHTELLEKGGLYKNLWDKQIGGFLQDYS